MEGFNDKSTRYENLENKEREKIQELKRKEKILYDKYLDLVGEIRIMLETNNIVYKLIQKLQDERDGIKGRIKFYNTCFIRGDAKKLYTDKDVELLKKGAEYVKELQKDIDGKFYCISVNEKTLERWKGERNECKEGSEYCKKEIDKHIELRNEYHDEDRKAKSFEKNRQKKIWGR